MFKVTKDWIHSNKTARGGWKKDQLQILGVAWPPVNGWIDLVTKNEVKISDFDRCRFELLAKDEK